jgi:hypothetical protein
MARPESQQSDSPKRYGPRGPLPPTVLIAAQAVSRAMWHEAYVEGRGVMHYGGGPAHAALLRGQARRWEHLARAARTCADWLGDGELPEIEQCPACAERGRPHVDCDPCGGTGWVAVAKTGTEPSDA